VSERQVAVQLITLPLGLTPTCALLTILSLDLSMGVCSLAWGTRRVRAFSLISCCLASPLRSIVWARRCVLHELSTLEGPLTIIIFRLLSVQGKYSLEVRSLISRRRYELELGQLQVTASRLSIGGQLQQCRAALGHGLQRPDPDPRLGHKRQLEPYNAPSELMDGDSRYTDTINLPSGFWPPASP